MSMSGNRILRDMSAGVAVTRSFGIAALLFGLLFGVAAAGSGMPSGLAVLMSATVFAGSAQFPALTLWADPIPIGAIVLAAGFATSRHLLMGLSLAPQFAPYPWPVRLSAIAVLTDVNWVATRNIDPDIHVPAFLAGSGLAMYVPWLAGTLLGIAIPDLIDPVSLAALSFGGVVFVTVLVTMVAKSVTGPRSPLIVAGLVSVAVTPTIGPSLGVIVSVLAGAVAAILARRLARGPA